MYGLPANARGTEDYTPATADTRMSGPHGVEPSGVAEGDAVSWHHGRARWERYDSDHDRHVYAPERPPLCVLRKPNGLPNYANADEQSRYLRDSGWLAWSVAKAERRRLTPEEFGVVPWETWIEARNDPRRQPPPSIAAELAARVAPAGHDDDEYIFDEEVEWEPTTEAA